METKTAFIIFVIICLCFFGIPIRIPNKISEHERLFESYIFEYNKSYRHNKTEYMLRFEHFKNSLKIVEELNKDRTSNESARYGLTKFSDLSREEFQRFHLQKNHTKHKHRKDDISNKLIEVNRIKRAVGTLPAKVDWRDQKIVGPVRNQRTCGACWAFSVVETVESMLAIRTGTLQQLSVQEVIDCAGNGNYGCDGGDNCALIEWLVSTKTKIQPESSYPFVYQTNACKLKPSSSGVQVYSNYTCEYLVGNENELLTLLANHGPVAVAVNAINWQFYLGGVIQFHCSGSPENLNHAVQIVGYDKTSAVPHYIVRNSWGVEFGEKGYLYLAIGTNICGLANEVSSLDAFSV